MQTGKSAVEAVKETGANVVASAKAGMEKTKGTVQEKVEKMTARDPVESEMAIGDAEEERKDSQAEREKLAARERQAGEREHVGGATGGTTAGVYGQPHSQGHVTEGAVESHPVGINTGTGGTTGATHETYGAGGGYS